MNLIALFLTSSPLVPKPVPKCLTCEKVHVIGPSVAYCQVCHHPVVK